MQHGFSAGSGSPSWQRLGFATAYAVSVLLACGSHEHPGESRHAPDVIVDCCVDGDVHLEHHPDAPDLSPHFTSCPACQHRANDFAPLDNVSGHWFVVSSYRHVDRATGAPHSTNSRPSSRAPPIS